MDIYQTIENTLLEKTPFIFVKTEHLEIYQDAKSDEPFATLQCKGQRIRIDIVDFVDWFSVRCLMKLGHHLLSDLRVNDSYMIKKIIILCDCDMDDEFIYEYRTTGRVWYSGFGYIPYLNTWFYSKIKDFYQLPFLCPKEFLELIHAKQFICPKKIILEAQKDPLHLICQKDPNVLQLRNLPSTSFYSQSKRPITSMTLLRQPTFKCLDLSKISGDTIKSGRPFKIENDFYIPVVRYSYGMCHGYYFDKDSTKEYLGTFYYWEPESGCYLNMGKKFDYFESKMDCAIELLQKLEEHYDMYADDRASKLFLKLERFVYKILENISRSFKKKHEEYFLFQKNVGDVSDHDKILENDFLLIFQGKTPKYLRIDMQYRSTITNMYMKSLFYASEDELDQILAKTLIFLGYDVVVLGRMAGMYRVVTEVMDVREREESLGSLCWRVD